MKSLILAVLFSSFCLAQTTNPVVRNPFTGTFGATALNIGGSGVTTQSHFSLFAPTLPTLTDLFRVSVNNCPIGAEWGAGGTNVLQGIVGCTVAPANVNLGGVSTGGSFYSIGGAGTANTPAVGVFAGCNPGGDDNAGCWGANFAGTNVDMAGVGHHTSAWGLEVDCNQGSGTGGSVGANCWGVAAVSSAAQQPDGAYDAFDARITPGSAFAWKNGFTSEPGAAEVGMELWPRSEFGSNSPSQPIQFVSKDSSGNFLLSNFYLDTTGSYQMQVGQTGGNLNLTPQVVPNANSPALAFTSYNGSSAAQVGEVFLDFFGNMNIKPSATSFSSTQFLNGSGVAVAEVDTAAFRMDPRSADPGCSAIGQIGSFWFDNTTSTTDVKVCVSASGSIAWRHVTTTP